MILYNGTCKCNKGSYLNIQKSQCINCNPDCIHCITYQCYECVAPKYIKMDLCVDDCTNGYYKNDKNIKKCLKCSNSCEICINSNICLTCKINSYLFSNQCICNKNFYLNSLGQCVPCGNNCEKCKSLVLCQVCQAGYFIHSVVILNYSQNICISQCPFGYFVQNNSRCLPCLGLCQTCLLNGFDCLTCKTNGYKIGN